jgi:hypothetical protein
MAWLLLASVALWLILAPSAQGQARPVEKIEVVKSEGCGTILGGDTARARDEAIISNRPPPRSVSR